MMEPALQAVLAGVVSLSLTPLVRRYSLRRALLDRPGPRRSHVGTVPRGGGPALLLALIAGTLWIPGAQTAAFVAGGLVIGLLITLVAIFLFVMAMNMIGDGVNDVLSLKKAQIGISMQSGSAATRAKTLSLVRRGG